MLLYVLYAAGTELKGELYRLTKERPHGILTVEEYFEMADRLQEQNVGNVTIMSWTELAENPKKEV